MKNIDTMDKQELFQEYQIELKALKSWIENNSLSKKQIKQIKSSFYNWFVWLENNIDTNEKQNFQDILDKLKDPDQNLDSSDISFLEQIFTELETKQLEQTDLQQLRDNTKDVRNTKSKLNKLKQTDSGKLTLKQEKIKNVK